MDAQTLVAAIRRVASGGKHISQAVGERLANQLVGNGQGAPHERLSERLFEVFPLIAAGANLTEISLKLYVSVKTVSGYRARLLEKTGFRTNADSTCYALEHHLIE